MKKIIKFNNFILAVIIAIILFGISTFLQIKLINKEDTVTAVITKNDIKSNTILTKDMFEIIDIPRSLSNDKLIKSLEFFDKKVNISPLFKGQLVYEQYMKKEGGVDNIKVEQGKENISIKIKESENALSYQIRAGDLVNLYFVGKYEDVANIMGYMNIYPQIITQNNICTIKILDRSTVLGVFDNKGIFIDNGDVDKTIDTVMFGVTSEQSNLIQALIPNGYFNITSVKGE